MNWHRAVFRRLAVCSFAIIAGFFFGSLTLPAQTNSWTSPSSGHWEDSSWSLGILPAADQSVMITNAGSKAVGIFPTTPVNFPASMTVNELTIDAPTGAVNTLLLNYAGTAVPLNVLSNCLIGTNGNVVSLYSGLTVGGDLNLAADSASFTQVGGVTIVTNGSLEGWGIVATTNATLAAPGIYFGGSATLNQSGGSTTADTLSLVEEATVNLFGGLLAATNLWVGENFPGGSINQYGGQIVSPSGLSMREGAFFQNGGNSFFGSISVGDLGLAFPGYYELSNGIVVCGDLLVANGRFSQMGGDITVSNSLGLVGFFPPGDDYGTPEFGDYELEDGVLECGAIQLDEIGNFSQDGGTNMVAGDINANGGGYALSAGMLSVSNITIDFSSGFSQGGGLNQVGNTLFCAGDYNLYGGTLVAPSIVVQGSLNIGSPGSSATISNAISLSLAGTIKFWTNSTQHLASLELGSNSVIDLYPSSNQLEFANSSGRLWKDGATLTITNWNGSLSGGGSNSLFFGDSAEGLTVAQLQQIRFVNPAGFPAGTWSAKMLPTGEVVPALSLLTFSLSGSSLVVQWPTSSNIVLQAATNAAGPFEDISNAVAPFTNDTTQFPQRFFRLRQ